MAQMIKGLVSVIIPSHNSSRTIGEAIESAINQSYENIEIIIVDNGSKDGTASIIYSYSRNYPYIKILIIHNPIGPAAARNRAIEIAQGQYMAFLDSDDIWHRSKLKTQIIKMEEHKAAFSCTAVDCFNNDHYFLQKREVQEWIHYNDLLRCTEIATSSVIIDRSILNNVCFSLYYSAEDYATWLSILKSGVNCLGVNEFLTSYRVKNRMIIIPKISSVWQIIQVQFRQEKLPLIQVLTNVFTVSLYAFRRTHHNNIWY